MSEPGGHLEISRAGLLRAPTGRLRPQEARDCLGRPRRPNSALPDFSSLCRGLGPAGLHVSFLPFWDDLPRVPPADSPPRDVRERHPPARARLPYQPLPSWRMEWTVVRPGETDVDPGRCWSRYTPKRGLSGSDVSKRQESEWSLAGVAGSIGPSELEAALE
nr:PREDICTED: uncharacterized protein LOC103550226 [Equus przewalskii]